jgi:putative endonuclease
MDQDPPALWHLYIVACADGTLYTGVAKDIEARVRQHNNGKGARYTRGRMPVDLVYSERVGTHGDALRRERQVKMMGLSCKRRLIEGVEQ